MHVRNRTLDSISLALRTAGFGAAARLARAASEDGSLDPRDVPEVLLALRAGEFGFLHTLRNASPGTVRFSHRP